MVISSRKFIGRNLLGTLPKEIYVNLLSDSLNCTGIMNSFSMNCLSRNPTLSDSFDLCDFFSINMLKKKFAKPKAISMA